MRAGDALLIKRLAFGGQRQTEEDEIRVVWRLVSDNPAYPPIEVDCFTDADSDVKILGRVTHGDAMAIGGGRHDR